MLKYLTQLNMLIVLKGIQNTIISLFLLFYIFKIYFLCRGLFEFDFHYSVLVVYVTPLTVYKVFYLYIYYIFTVYGDTQAGRTLARVSENSKGHPSTEEGFLC